jgi:Holliday junction resolvase RusA-like endonuclease
MKISASAIQDFVEFKNKIMEKINIKALSVNSCFQGKRYKNQVHKDYVNEVLRQLPIKYIGRPPYKLILEFGLSSKLQDLDNCIKVFQDCLTVKYDFNDRDIYELQAQKFNVEKGKEFIKFDIIEKK